MSLALHIPFNPTTPSTSSTTLATLAAQDPSSAIATIKSKASLDEQMTSASTETPSSPTTPPASILRRQKLSPSPKSVIDPVDDAAWGSNFWVTLVDPQTQTSFFACPATGQVSWDPPVGHFVLPPSSEGEWWELSDDSRGGLPYYYQTKTGETVWERPTGFVIPLGILQNTALGRRLSHRTPHRTDSTDSIDPRRPSTSSSISRSHSQGTPAQRKSSEGEYAVAAAPVDQQHQSHSNQSASTRQRSASSRGLNGTTASTANGPALGRPAQGQMRRSYSNDPQSSGQGHHSHDRKLASGTGQLTPIPGSPYVTASEASNHSKDTSAGSSRSRSSKEKDRERDRPANGVSSSQTNASYFDSLSRARAKNAAAGVAAAYVPHRTQPQSLNAAVEMLTNGATDNGTDGAGRPSTCLSDTGRGSPPSGPTGRKIRIVTEPIIGGMSTNRKTTGSSSGGGIITNGDGKQQPQLNVFPPSPRPDIYSSPSSPLLGSAGAVTINGKEISKPILNRAATLEMSPVKNRAAGQPIFVETKIQLTSIDTTSATTLSSGSYPILPEDLANDIQHFSESDYAKQYFSTHKTGFIFKRKIPVNQMMTWQKAPLTTPLLALTKGLTRQALRSFKVIQHIMGDRERDRPLNGVSSLLGGATLVNASTTSLGTNGTSSTSSANSVGVSSSTGNASSGSGNGSQSSSGGNAANGGVADGSTASPAAPGGTVEYSVRLEEERWLLGEGLSCGELRDEIYCQLMKQLTGNPNTESTFKGWQLVCVLLITFPPSKNFETYLRSFMQQRTTQQEGRVDVMAKYCLRRLDFIAKKGPRGKPPSCAEIEVAADAAFNPSTFGESLDAIIRLQQRNYPHQKVPIILPFLADGILALGGPKAEGIFRVPGDSDSVSELKLRIDRGYYTLDGVDDPHVLASLMKLWLRELCDPLVPEEMYNTCIASYEDPQKCVKIVEKLPTINRRVVVFIISFLQLFLEERTQTLTKMTPANLALVMAPNLLRCSSDLMSVVFTNAQYEQIFVYNLLLHLKCDEVDQHYKPLHGLGAVTPTPPARVSKSRSRRPQH